jgi:hypothetical protein
MEAFIQHVLRELKVIRSAPLAFFGAVLVIAFGVWWAMDWRYSSIVTHRESEISILKTERDEYKDQLASAPVIPKPQRRLTDDQKVKLVDELKPLADDIKQIFVFAEAAREPTLFAVEFISAFKTAGITSVGPLAVIPNYATESGVLVGLGNPENPSDLAKKYMAALRTADLKINTTKWQTPFGALDFDLYICSY